MAADHHTEPDDLPTGRLLGMAARLDERRINRAIGHLGLTKGSLEALETIAELHATRASDLAALLCVSPQSMGKVVQRLQGLGLLSKQRGRDGRTASIELTQDGVEALDAAEDLLQELTQPLTDADPDFRSNLAHRVGDLRSLQSGKSPTGHSAADPGAT